MGPTMFLFYETEKLIKNKNETFFKVLLLKHSDAEMEDRLENVVM